MTPFSDVPLLWPWGEDVSARALQRLGQNALMLYAYPELWIHRRVDRVSFLDYETARHQVSVDFTLPDEIAPVADFRGSPVYVAPLFTLLKERAVAAGAKVDRRASLGPPYSAIDVFDHSGGRLPLLTRRQSARIAAVALTERAAELVQGVPNDTLTRTIAQITTASRPLSRVALTEALKDTALSRDPVFRELAYAFSVHSMVCCLFTDRPRRRCIVKLVYDEKTNLGIAIPKGRIRRSVGWKSEQLFIGLPEIGASATHHVEVEIPPELEVNEVGLKGVSYEFEAPDLTNVPRSRTDYYIKQVGRDNFGHVYLSRTAGRSVGLAWVKLRAQRSGFLTSALVAALTTSAVLWLVALHVPQITTAERSDAATALLLLVPTVLAAYIARPGEHAITTRMLRWARIALVVDGALPFLAAFDLLTVKAQSKEPSRPGAIHPHLHRLSSAPWILLAGVSLVFLLLFALSNVLPRPHGTSLHHVNARRNRLKANRGALQLRLF